MGEWKDVQGLFQKGETPEQICKARTEYSMKWYIRKANWNKWIYYCFSFVGVICPLLNAVLVVCWDSKIATVILASITSLSTSLLALTKAKSKWQNYRSAAEFLKCEYTLFQAGVGIYGSECRETLYLETIENFMKKIHINWQKIFEKDSSKIDEMENQ